MINIIILIVAISTSITSIIFGVKLVNRNKEIEKLQKVDSDITLTEKVFALIDNNMDEFSDMACKDVEIVFNPSTQRAMVSNQYSIEENISDFF